MTHTLEQPEADAVIITQVDVGDISETSENWQIYRQPSVDESEFIELCRSIAANGINTPVELSADRYLISGHRRYRAALKCGLRFIPATVDNTVVIEAMSSADRIALLTERNRGTRIKSDAEQYLEAAARVDPEQAIREAQERKAEHFNKAKCSSVEMVEIQGKSRRTDPSLARSAMLSAVIDILKELNAKDHLPTSSRHLHYRLLATKVKTSSYRSGFVYGTRPGSAGLLSKLLTDARSAGWIDADAINDETRPTQTMEHDGSMASYIADKLDGLFSNYFSDVHADQPHHLELLIEKNTVYPLLYKHVAQTFRLPISSMRGYGSFPVSRDIAARFKASGKDSLVIVYVSDLDPEGVDMPSAVKKYLMEDFSVDAQVVRAAVTTEQVARFNLPPDIDVKLTSSRANGFIEKYGDQCWELDSMPTETLINEVSENVKAFLDIDAFNRALVREKTADVELARMTAAVGAFVSDHFREQLKGTA